MTVLQTARLSLRPYRADDAPVIAALIADWDVIAMLGRPPHPYSLQDAEAFVSQAATSPTQFAVTLADTGAFVGACGYDLRDRDVPELGYWIGKPFWGRGYALEAARAVAAHAFAGGCPELAVSCRVENDRSRRVIEKLGACFAGLGEMHSRPLGRVVPVRLYRLAPEALRAD